jgi:hypothetical protein
MEDLRMSEQMAERTCHKTHKEQLRPTPAQERQLEQVLGRCPLSRTLQHGPRIAHHGLATPPRLRVSVTRYQQEAELKAIRAEFLEYEVAAYTQ